MVGSIKLPLNMALILSLVVLGMLCSYQAAKTGAIGQPMLEIQAVTPTPAPAKVQRYLLGEVLTPTMDEEMHYIKIEVELSFQGMLEKAIEERKYEIKELFSQTLTKMTIQRAKADYADGFLQKDLEKGVNRLLGTSESQGRVEKVTVSAFMVN